ncbi:MAG: transglutaminaseTgpA domain-containing protein, partial [Nocardioidaceae bacterium]
MSAHRLHWPSSALPSALAALTTWVTLLTWSGFAERSSGYLVPLLGGCLLVALAGTLLRAARVPAPLVLLGQVVVVAGWLHHRWAADLALGGWLPTGASLERVSATLSQSVAAAGQYAAPVPKSVPAFAPIMILLGIAVALLVDFLACGLRRAPLAGLPLLAAYTAPISILDGGVSWLKFALAAVCFLALVASEEAERLARWGQQLSQQVFDTQGTTVGRQAVWSSARKIGLTATGLAVVVPLLIPTLPSGLLDGRGDGPGGDGEAVGISNPIVDMKRDLTQGDDVELVRVRTDDPDPSYLRISVLDEFDGTSWRPSGRDIPVSQRADGLVPRPPGLESGVPVRTDSATISTSADFRSRWLPVPYPVHSIQAPGDWRYDRSTLDFISAADGQTAAGLTYQLQSLRITPSAAELAGASSAPSSVYDPGIQLPDSLPASVGKLARSVTDGALTDYDKAVRLQRWFRVDGGFRYSLRRAPGNGVDALTHFLGTGKDSRVGYCEQFAAAMAVMARTLKIPARVAVGFLRPEPTGEPDVWVYSAHDLHAWPELYFQGVGWVRFEPTPGSRTGGAPAWTRRGALVQPALPSDTSSAALPVRNRLDRPAAKPERHATPSATRPATSAVRMLQGFGAAAL